MSAERSPDVRRSPPKNIFGGRPADPRGTGRSPRVPRGFGRNRGGRSSAEPIAGPACRAWLRFGYPSFSTVFGLLFRALFYFRKNSIILSISLMYDSLYYLKSFK